MDWELLIIAVLVGLIYFFSKADKRKAQVVAVKAAAQDIQPVRKECASLQYPPQIEALEIRCAELRYIVRELVKQHPELLKHFERMYYPPESDGMPGIEAAVTRLYFPSDSEEYLAIDVQEGDVVLTIKGKFSQFFELMPDEGDPTMEFLDKTIADVSEKIADVKAEKYVILRAFKKTGEEQFCDLAPVKNIDEYIDYEFKHGSSYKVIRENRAAHRVKLVSYNGTLSRDIEKTQWTPLKGNK